MTGTDDRLIDAIHDDRLADLDHSAAQAVCRAIGLRVADEVAGVLTVLEAGGIEVSVEGDPSAPAQRHGATLILTDTARAIAAARMLEGYGYRLWEPIDGPAEPVIRRFRSSLTVARTEDVTIVLELRWPPTAVGKRLPAALIPNRNDYEAVALPTWLWPLYLVVRPLRLLGERVGLREPSAQTLGPFLSTPHDLIQPLLDLAGLEADDTLVDLGCGDARILRHAVTERGCRGVGVESDPVLVDEARRLVAAEGLADHITIVEGDADAEQLPPAAAQASVFVLFVPAHAVPPVAQRLLAQARPGSRLVIHEQHPLPDIGVDMVSIPLLSGQGVTVAHRIVVNASSTVEADRAP